ncbi:MAG: enoyl-CoA hydratase/isomerase family protein [Dehalococcoidia bacterium]|nr:enoyl-CoA hydratase/isomerase family protein [Dehalococcoidia bacterium]
MPYETIIYEKKGQIAYITLNRPQLGNAINAQMTRELADACQGINEDEEISVVILKATEGVFSSGSDPKEWEMGCDAPSAVASLGRVVIAAINGDAWGEGLELALACDIRIASEGARFCLPHTGYGLIPRGGGTQRLPRLVGKGKALEMILTAEPIDAQEAFRIGLVNRVVPSEKLLQEVEEIAKRITTRGPIALRYAKEAINKGLDLTLEQGLRLEADLYFLIQTTADRMEGIRGFLEKRPPQFKGQ